MPPGTEWDRVQGDPPDPGRVSTPAGLIAALRAVRAWAGDVTYRELEQRCRAAGDKLSRSSISRMLASATAPPRRSMVAFLRACGIPPEQRGAWTEALDRAQLAARGIPGGGSGARRIHRRPRGGRTASSMLAVRRDAELYLDAIRPILRPLIEEVLAHSRSREQNGRAMTEPDGR